VLDIEFTDDNTYIVKVNGTLHVVADADSNATFTCHKTGGDLANGEGFRIHFDTAASYDPTPGVGCFIQNTEITNISRGNDAIRCINTSPRFYNCKVTSNMSTGGSYFEIKGTSAPIIHYCSFNYIVLTTRNDLRSTDAIIERNICRNGYYSIYFAYQSHSPIDSGQVINNDFDGTTAGVQLNGMTGDYSIPLDNNYWEGGIPSINRYSSDVTVLVDFDPTLGSPPEI